MFVVIFVITGIVDRTAMAVGEEETLVGVAAPG
jgi:hypothetical protein